MGNLLHWRNCAYAFLEILNLFPNVYAAISCLPDSTHDAFFSLNQYKHAAVSFSSFKVEKISCINFQLATRNWSGNLTTGPSIGFTFSTVYS